MQSVQAKKLFRHIAVNTAWALPENVEIHSNENSHMYKTKNRGRRRFRGKELISFR